MKNNNKLQRVIKLNKETVSSLNGMGGNNVVNMVVSTGNANYNQGNAMNRLAGGGNGGNIVEFGCPVNNDATNSCDNKATCWTCESPEVIDGINYPGTCTCIGGGNTNNENVTCNINNCDKDISHGLCGHAAPDGPEWEVPDVSGGDPEATPINLDPLINAITNIIRHTRGVCTG
jgi:hypothetical protein